ncbi:MAG: peptide deformylase [Gloeomargarita sp. SKYBB_i_bin120]|nr:peptide deformylase [Gloeomargarita sp. SKYG98]MCS7291946.1 peptide deformylase [Gloeomargarita sp. SKYB120]MDW8177506.1 peptide deformylase [Gloeomargarita sp. SKYBB_i_bin120]
MTTAALPVEKTKLAAPPLRVEVLGSKVLRQTAKRVPQVNQELRDLAVQMLQTMYSREGIGLAAPQVGILKQVIVVDTEPDNAATPPLVLVNPVIEAQSEEWVVGEEGCLSIPGVFLPVKRPAQVTVSYRDEWGRWQRRQFTDLLARVVLHEMDHLQGVMFVDRVENPLALARELSKHRFSLADVRRVR